MVRTNTFNIRVCEKCGKELQPGEKEHRHRGVQYVSLVVERCLRCGTMLSRCDRVCPVCKIEFGEE